VPSQYDTPFLHSSGTGKDERNVADSQGSGHGGDRDYSGISPAGVDCRVEVTW
jgi:hypothetical protein